MKWISPAHLTLIQLRRMKNNSSILAHHRSGVLSLTVKSWKIEGNILKKLSSCATVPSILSFYIVVVIYKVTTRCAAEGSSSVKGIQNKTKPKVIYLNQSWSCDRYSTFKSEMGFTVKFKTKSMISMFWEAEFIRLINPRTLIWQNMLDFFFSGSSS